MAEFVAIKTRRIYSEIVDQIKRLMDSGELHVGDRLPPERELAARFGVGRPAVREALSALEMTGLITVQPGQGAYIKATPKQMESRALRLEAELADQVSPLDLLEARRLVEPHIVELAASRASQEDIDRLNAIVSAVKLQCEKTGEFSMEADRQFHIAIGEATQNVVLAGVSRFLCGMMSQALWNAMTEKNLLNKGRAVQYADDHARIARAIQDRDAHAARNSMFIHLTGVIEDLYEDGSGSSNKASGDEKEHGA